MPSKETPKKPESNKLTREDLLKQAKKISWKYCITDGKKFKLNQYSTKPSPGIESEDKPSVKSTLEQGIHAMATMQDILYAQDRWSLLVIFQAMDAAGKDGAIKHVMSGINPQGCQVSTFKVPSDEDLDHDFLWRCTKKLPERGRIGIFNRSYYEEVLVVKVHEEILKKQKLPEKRVTKKIWEERYKDIRNFEKYLNQNGTVIIKIFLHLSKEEQKNRFIERIEDPSKNWKFSPNDIKERAHWDRYMETYEKMIQETATKESPWYVIPADNKNFARMVVASAIINALDQMDLQYPTVSPEKIEELQKAKIILMQEDSSNPGITKPTRKNLSKKAKKSKAKSLKSSGNAPENQA